MLRVLDIKEGTTVDGPGLRTSIYFSGCSHHCEGCHNPQSWDYEAGHEMTVDEIMKVIDYNNFDVTFSGGDPLFQLDEVTNLAREIKRGGRNIWCYTGYKWEVVSKDARYSSLLENIDVLVDGPFVLAKRDISLLFRGSDNQRLIDVRKSLDNDRVVEWTM